MEERSQTHLIIPADGEREKYFDNRQTFLSGGSMLNVYFCFSFAFHFSCSVLVAIRSVSSFEGWPMYDGCMEWNGMGRDGVCVDWTVVVGSVK